MPRRCLIFRKPRCRFWRTSKTSILVEAERPVSFFAYPGTPSYMTPDSCVNHVLARRGEDGTAALEALAEGFPALRLPEMSAPAAPLDDVPLTLDHLGLTVAALFRNTRSSRTRWCPPRV